MTSPPRSNSCPTLTGHLSHGTSPPLSEDYAPTAQDICHERFLRRLFEDNHPDNTRWTNAPINEEKTMDCGSESSLLPESVSNFLSTFMGPLIRSLNVEDVSPEVRASRPINEADLMEFDRVQLELGDVVSRIDYWRDDLRREQNGVLDGGNFGESGSSHMTFTPSGQRSTMNSTVGSDIISTAAPDRVAITNEIERLIRGLSSQFSTSSLPSWISSTFENGLILFVSQTSGALYPYMEFIFSTIWQMMNSVLVQIISTIDRAFDGIRSLMIMGKAFSRQGEISDSEYITDMSTTRISSNNNLSSHLSPYVTGGIRRVWEEKVTGQGLLEAQFSPNRTEYATQPSGNHTSSDDIVIENPPFLKIANSSGAGISPPSLIFSDKFLGQQ